MDIKKDRDGKVVIVKITGNITSATAPQLAEAISEDVENCDVIKMDFNGAEYMSSAGLRVLLAVHKHMSKKNGSLIIYGVNDVIMDIFEVTGFADILTIE